jgi:soluble cytochrome b562
VQVRVGDKVIKIPAYQAGVRATMTNAARGSNPAMRNAHIIVSHAHDQARAELEERINAAVAYKEAATARAYYCKRRGIRFDWDIHPNDVHLDLNTGDVFIQGTMNQGEREVRQMMFDTLDFASASLKKLAEQVRENPRLKKVRERIGLFVMTIDRTNAWLPTHYHEAIDPEIRAMAIMPDESSGE